MHEKAKIVCFIYMQTQKMKFKSVQINMKQVSYIIENLEFVIIIWRNLSLIEINLYYMIQVRLYVSMYM